MSNKAVVATLVSAIDQGHEAGVRNVVAEDLVSHGALGEVHGADGFVELVSAIEEGDMVSFRLDGSGTHLGPFLGVQPTGKTIRGIHLRVRGGRIVEHWQGPDILAMLIDMGLFPPT